MHHKSSSAASDVSLGRFGLRIALAVQPSAARDRTSECVAKRKRAAPLTDAHRVLAHMLQAANSAQILSGCLSGGGAVYGYEELATPFCALRSSRRSSLYQPLAGKAQAAADARRSAGSSQRGSRVAEAARRQRRSCERRHQTARFRRREYGAGDRVRGWF